MGAVKKKSIRKRILSVGFAAALIIFCVIYLTVLQKDVSGISLGKQTAERGDIQATVLTTGTLNPVTVVDIGSQVSGLVTALYADFNSHVEKGQALARLDPEPFEVRVKQAEASNRGAQADLEKAKINYDNAESKYERAKVLFDKALISIEEKETVESQYLSAKADVVSARSRLVQSKSALDSAKVDLSYTVIESPISGVVINRAINVGQTVAARFAAPTLFQIADDLTKMRVECNIREANIGMVRQGQEVEFTVDAYPGLPFNGRVSQVRFAPEQVQNVVSYITVVDVDNPDMKLLPGMTANITIAVGQAQDVLLVPNAALRFVPPSDLGLKLESGPGDAAEAGGPRAGGDLLPDGLTSEQWNAGLRSVWVREANGPLRMVLVRTGLTDTAKTEIRAVVQGELHEGDTVVTWAKTPESERLRKASSMRRGHFH